MTQSPIQLSTTVARASDLMTENLDDELVMMNLNSNAYYGLDDIGNEIWNLLETPRTVYELCNLLMKKFEVDSTRAEADVLAFLDELYMEKIIILIG